jgi:hypothetical protein
LGIMAGVSPGKWRWRGQDILSLFKTTMSRAGRAEKSHKLALNSLLP